MAWLHNELQRLGFALTLYAPEGSTLRLASLPNGRPAMRLLSKKQVREKVLYSPAHIARLEAAGLFPKRIRLGQGRVGWLEHEIEIGRAHV